jgi:hypothetical protein
MMMKPTINYPKTCGHQACRVRLGNTARIAVALASRRQTIHLSQDSFLSDEDSFV